MGPPHPPWLPVQLAVAGRRCVVVGAGAVGSRRIAALLEAGAVVRVVEPSPSPELLAAADAGEVELVRHEAEAADVEGAVLVVVATGRPEVDGAVARAAAGAGALVNRADAAEHGDLAFPAVVRRGPLRVAVSTGAAAPAVTRWAARTVDAGLDELLGLDATQLEALVEVVAEVRRSLDAASGTRTLDWRTGLDGTILDLIRQGRTAEAKERLLACLSSS